MIKVIIERKVKKGEDISRLLRELRATAIEARARLYRRIEPLLVEKPKVKVYEILATERKTA